MKKYLISLPLYIKYFSHLTPAGNLTSDKPLPFPPPALAREDRSRDYGLKLPFMEMQWNNAQ